MGTPLHGSVAVVYLSPGTGAAILVGELTDYSIELDADIQDVSALGSSWGSSVRGMNKWSGSLGGNFDTASRTLWLAGTSVAAQRLYIYADRTDATKYYYGMAFVKLGRAIAGGTTAKISVSATFTGQGELGLN